MNDVLSDYFLLIQFAYNNNNTAGDINLDPLIESRFFTPTMINIELNCTHSLNRMCVNESQLLVTIDGGINNERKVS